MVLTTNDLVFHKTKGKTYANNFEISNILKRHSPLINDSHKDDDLFTMFDKLSVPIGIYSVSHTSTCGPDCDDDECELLDEDLHDQLLSLVEFKPKSHMKTRHKKQSTEQKKRKTLKNK
jgi:hypothetical protein